MKKKKILIRKKEEILHLEEEMRQLLVQFFVIGQEDWDKNWEEIEEFALFYHSGKLVGFSGIVEEEFQLSNRKVWVVCLRMAVIKREFRNNYFLQRSLIRLVFREFFRARFVRVYMWAYCAHYKSYLALAKSLKHTYPSYQHETPTEASELIHKIGNSYYGPKYNPETMVVARNNWKGIDEDLMPPSKYAEDPDIRFYLSRMVKYDRGEEGLIAVTPCTWKNFGHISYTFLRSAVRRVLGLRRKKIQPRATQSIA